MVRSRGGGVSGQKQGRGEEVVRSKGGGREWSEVREGEGMVTREGKGMVTREGEGMV